MTLEVFVTLLVICGIITPFFICGVVMFLDRISISYSVNILALTIAAIVGWGVTALYYVNFNVPFDGFNTVCFALMGIVNGFIAMVLWT